MEHGEFFYFFEDQVYESGIFLFSAPNVGKIVLFLEINF